MKYISWWARETEAGVALERREAIVPQPAEGEILIRVCAAALNRREFLHRMPPSMPAAEWAAGVDAAGVVEAVGSGVDRWQKGDRVMTAGRGAFADYMICDARYVIPIPDSLGWAEAAAVPVTMLTAYDIIYNEGRLAANEWALITAISSGVGVACLQLAKQAGAKVIGTSASQDKLKKLREMGLDVAIATRAPDFKQAVQQATNGNGVDLVVNAVGGSVFSECLACLAYKGRLATVGYLDGNLKAEIDLSALHGKRLHVFGVSARLQTPQERSRTVSGFTQHILPLLSRGEIRPLIDKIFSFDDLPLAKNLLESNAHLGKIVIVK